MGNLKELLVVVPHSGLVVPAEVAPGALSERFGALVRNVDWHTNWLYDFRDILDNRHVVFPYLSLIIEANRRPDLIDECVPLADVHGEPVYRAGMEPGQDLRRLLAQKYLVPFNKRIEAEIMAGADFLLDGHSTIEARGVAANQIDLMNFQHSKHESELKRFSPMAFIETYAEELQRRLPEVKVTVNQSEYHSVYGHVCAEHSVNAFSRVGRRVPAVIQETCERLYRNPGETPDVQAMDRLRRAFAESIRHTLEKVRSLKKVESMIDLRATRQISDFDCGAQALQTVMAYYGVEVRADALLSELDADPEKGVSIDRMVAVAESHGFQVEAGQSWRIEDIRRYVSEGHPVIVLLQAWARKYMTLKDWRNDFEDGHYAIVTGFSRNVLFFEDPSSFHRTWLKDSEFLARWHDKDPRTGENLMRFGMVLLGREPQGKLMEHMG